MAKKKFKNKLKTFRTFLENVRESDSYIKVMVGTTEFEAGEVHMKLTDCDRRITWYFGAPGDARAVAKITTVKQIVDKVYDYLTQETE